MGFVNKALTKKLMEPHVIETALSPPEVLEQVRTFVASVPPQKYFMAGEFSYRLVGVPGEWHVQYVQPHKKNPDQLGSAWTVTGRCASDGVAGSSRACIQLTQARTTDGKVDYRSAFVDFRDHFVRQLT